MRIKVFSLFFFSTGTDSCFWENHPSSVTIKKSFPLILKDHAQISSVPLIYIIIYADLHELTALDGEVLFEVKNDKSIISESVDIRILIHATLIIKVHDYIIFEIHIVLKDMLKICEYNTENIRIYSSYIHYT